jgi:hypothetical protein
MQGRLWLLVSLLSLAELGCREENREYYCPAHPSDPRCSPTPEQCGDIMCAAPRPVCDTATTTCVQCTDDSHCLGGYCDNTQHTCVECRVDDECPSKLCLLDQTCAAPEDVTYVGGSSTTDNVTCSIDLPCQNLEQGTRSTALRKYIKITGAVVDAGVATIYDKEVTIYGRSGAQVSRAAAGEVLIITGTNAPKVAIFDLEVVGNAGGSGKDCVEISETATATLTGVNVHDHGQAGISLAMTAKLVMYDSQVHDNALEGIKALVGTTADLHHSSFYRNCTSATAGEAGIYGLNAAMMTIERSIIAANLGVSGGVSIAGPFSITNSIIAENGNVTKAVSSPGGLTLSPGSAANAKFEFNTVSDNTSAATTTGMTCAGVMFDVSNSIFTGNTVSNCNVAYSLTALSGTPMGLGNKTGDPLFLSKALGNAQFFHISGSSPARDSADPTSTFELDIDGDQRKDARRDMGADEVRAP